MIKMTELNFARKRERVKVAWEKSFVAVLLWNSFRFKYKAFSLHDPWLPPLFSKINCNNKFSFAKAITTMCSIAIVTGKFCFGWGNKTGQWNRFDRKLNAIHYNTIFWKTVFLFQSLIHISKTPPSHSITHFIIAYSFFFSLSWVDAHYPSRSSMICHSDKRTHQKVHTMRLTRTG